MTAVTGISARPAVAAMATIPTIPAAATITAPCMGKPDGADPRYIAHVSGRYFYMGRKDQQTEKNDDVPKSHNRLQIVRTGCASENPYRLFSSAGKWNCTRLGAAIATPG